MKLSIDSPLQKLLDTVPQKGTLVWIGIRPVRKVKLIALNEVAIIAGEGLAGDHFSVKSSNKREVTLIQQEHIDAVGSYLSTTIAPELLRRNLVTKGINLLALKDKQFSIGETILQYTGECQPCSRMEENLGPGGYNAMRGHGGITASIVQDGMIRLGDKIQVI